MSEHRCATKIKPHHDVMYDERFFKNEKDISFFFY
jgi:hypothetical protein